MVCQRECASDAQRVTDFPVDGGIANSFADALPRLSRFCHTGPDIISLIPSCGSLSDHTPPALSYSN